MESFSNLIIFQDHQHIINSSKAFLQKLEVTLEAMMTLYCKIYTNHFNKLNEDQRVTKEDVKRTSFIVNHRMSIMLQ